MENKRRGITGIVDIIARVAIRGAIRGTGWRLTHYQYSHKDGKCRFIGAITRGMYPNKFNEQYTSEKIAEYEAVGYVYVYGRPTKARLEKVLSGGKS